MPDEGEAFGLHALLLTHHARRAARVDAAGALVLLEDQDRTLWDIAAIEQAMWLAARALRLGPPGRYALQAAIAVEHVTRRDRPDRDRGAVRPPRRAGRRPDRRTQPRRRHRARRRPRTAAWPGSTRSRATSTATTISTPPAPTSCAAKATTNRRRAAYERALALARRTRPSAPSSSAGSRRRADTACGLLERQFLGARTGAQLAARAQTELGVHVARGGTRRSWSTPSVCSPLTIVHALGASVRDLDRPGTGVTFTPALSQAYAEGATGLHARHRHHVRPGAGLGARVRLLRDGLGQPAGRTRPERGRAGHAAPDRATRDQLHRRLERHRSSPAATGARRSARRAARRGGRSSTTSRCSTCRSRGCPRASHPRRI